jgi:hypothetical protein
MDAGGAHEGDEIVLTGDGSASSGKVSVVESEESERRPVRLPPVELANRYFWMKKRRFYTDQELRSPAVSAYYERLKRSRPSKPKEYKIRQMWMSEVPADLDNVRIQRTAPVNPRIIVKAFDDRAYYERRPSPPPPEGPESFVMSLFANFRGMVRE